MLLVFAALVFDPANPLHEPWRVLCSVFLVQSWVGAYGLTFAGNSVAWTHSCELFFYLAFPFLTMLSSRMIIVVTVMVSVLTILWASWVAAFTAGSGGDVTSTAVDASAIVRTHPGASRPLHLLECLLGAHLRAGSGRSHQACARHWSI